MRRALLAGAGAVSAGFFGALCCAGPLLFVFFGVGAGLASTFEPLRPVFTALMIGALAFGFYVVYGRKRGAVAAPVVSAPEAACAVPLRRTRDEVLIWSAAAAALALWSFPYWLKLFI